MTGKERILKTFKGEKVDRVPICPFLHFNSVYRYFDTPPQKQNWRRNLEWEAIKAIEVADHFGFDHLHRMAAPYTHVYNEASSSDGKWIVEVDFKKIGNRDTEITTIRTPEKELRQVREYDQTSRYTYVEAITEYLIKEKNDFDQFVKYQPSFEEGTYRAIKNEFENFGRAKKALGDKGVIVGFAGGAFNMLNNYRNLELIMMEPYTDKGFYMAMIEYFIDRIFQIIEKLVVHGVDIIETGGNLATGGVGEKFFSENVLEYEKDIADKIHSFGIYDIYHNCGDADKIMHLYNEMGINAWGYITPPPFGDVDLDRALEIMNKEMVLFGNIDQVEFMKNSTPKQIEERVEEVLEKAKKRGNFILSTSDWWTDDMPYENITALSVAGHKFGKY